MIGMNRTTSKVVYILFICMLSNTLLFAQNKQGNIVEYFGKEKVDDINEGQLIHTFNKGLVLGQNRFAFGSNNTTPIDAVVGNHLLNPAYKIAEGETGLTDSAGKEYKWTSITINDKSEFSDRKLRSGYLYLEYQSEIPQTVIFEASGHTRLIANGLPHEGDHYDFGYSLIPIQLKKGKNTFLLTGGRFPKMRARLIKPNVNVQLTTRDMTLPDLLKEEDETLVGGIRIVNASHKWFKNGSVSVTVKGSTLSTLLPGVSPLNSRKVVISIPNVSSNGKTEEMLVQLKDRNKKLLSEYTVKLNVKSNKKHHKRTFVSQIDGSVQYYSVAPSNNDTLTKPALFLSVHGASVEATNQANAYKQKDWGHLVAPTNRRPFGFAWEDWGRLDALEVLNEAEKRFQTDKQRTYLTGHSMGGHGSWYLGATYPDKWGAIAPAAGYPDLLGYRGSFQRRLKSMTDEQLKRYGITREQAKKMFEGKAYDKQIDIELDSIIRRAGNPSRTLKLKRNYLHHGVYILHGEDDSVVPTFIARDMRALLGSYHPDFSYYEYPHGTHWYGNHSVDWPPIFDFFKFRFIKPSSEIDRLEFYTGSPGVSASSHFITINQQEEPFGISSFNFNRADNITVKTDNVSAMTIDLDKMAAEKDSIEVDGQIFDTTEKKQLTLKKNAQWKEVKEIALSEKGPHRNGGFKDAFRNNFVLVYATNGTKEENTWYYSRARADAEMFYYRANGNVEIIKDRDFVAADYKDRNVIVYGNADNNRAWKKLLTACPLQVKNGSLTLGNKTLKGKNYGAYYIYKRNDSDVASVGVVTATGPLGMKAAYANHYLTNATTFPDVLIFNDKVLLEGIAGVECSGFFGNDWSYETGDFVWRKQE
jgi:pimeloyl-ACP methyl ester carboxylesterase